MPVATAVAIIHLITAYIAKMVHLNMCHIATGTNAI